MDEGISPKALAVPSFEREERESLLERQTYQQQPLLTKMGMSVTIVTNTASVAGMKSFSGTQAYGIVPGLFYNHSTARTYMPGATTKEQRQIFGGNEQWTTQAPPQTVFQQSTM
jgi:hypothetical protein